MFACECTAWADRGRVSGRASSEQSVDRKHRSTGMGQSARMQEVVGQGQVGVWAGGTQGRRRYKGLRGAGKWVVERGAEARLRLSIRQIQGSHYGRVGAGTAARSAP